MPKMGVNPVVHHLPPKMAGDEGEGSGGGGAVLGRWDVVGLGKSPYSKGWFGGKNKQKIEGNGKDLGKDM